jgi:fucose permease
LLSETFNRARAKYLDILHIFVSLGCLANLLLVGIILAHTRKWYLVCFLMGLFSLTLPMFFWNKKLYGKIIFSETQEVIDNPGVNKLVNWRIFWPIIFSIFLYVGIGNSFALWTPLFLVKIRGVSTTIVSYYISIFWFVIIGGMWFFSKFSIKLIYVVL